MSGFDLWVYFLDVNLSTFRRDSSQSLSTELIMCFFDPFPPTTGRKSVRRSQDPHDGHRGYPRPQSVGSRSGAVQGTRFVVYSGVLDVFQVLNEKCG